MSWNNIGPHVLVQPGQSVTWEYSWANGKDMGLQIAGPNTFADPGDLGTLVASNQGKKINGINNVTYVVTITNVGPANRGGGVHNLQGGSVS